MYSKTRFWEEGVEIVKYDPDKDNPTYVGTNVDKTAAESDNTWVIWRLTSTEDKKAYGSWTNRTSLF